MYSALSLVQIPCVHIVVVGYPLCIPPPTPTLAQLVEHATVEVIISPHSGYRMVAGSIPASRTS